MVARHPLHCVGATLGMCSVPGRAWGPQGWACGVDEREPGPECTVQEALPWVAPGSWERGLPEPAPSCQPGFMMPSGHVGICSLGGKDAVLWGVNASQRAGVSRGGPAVALASSRLGGGNVPSAFVLVSGANLSRWSDCDTLGSFRDAWSHGGK